MLVFALMPPLPFTGKLVVTMVMLALAGMLIRDAGGTLTRQSIAVAVGVSRLIVIALETIPLPKYFRGLHEPSGLVAGFVGVLCGAIFLRPTSSVPKRQRASGPLRLFLLACISGPLFGLVWAYLTILLSNASPLDRGYSYSVYVGIGVFAGVFGGVMLVLASLPNR